MHMQNSPARSGIDVGSVIADTYTIEALIGRGGMGAVFLASHRRLPGKKVAIKMLHAEMSGAEVLARFKREAEIASRLGHPNIVQVHDFNVLPDGTPYLVLEYLHGESLAQRLARGPLALEQTTSILRQVGSALAAAHREGIVHRDLKPQNIFLVPTEVDGRIVEIAKVLDFGISKIRGSTTVKTQDSALLGTPQYMAPEQATGQHASVDERTDVFALGAIVYEMLAGHPAFNGETIPEVVFKVVYEQPAPLDVPALPARVPTAIARAMAKKSADRYPDVSSFVEGVTGQPLALTRPPSIPPPDVGFAVGSRIPNTDREAFAKTMGSGDHGVANAPTVDSQGDAGNARTVAIQEPAKRRPVALIVGVVIGVAALAAGGVYLAMRKTETAPATVASNAPVVVPVDAAVVAIASLDAAPQPDMPPPKSETPKAETPKTEAPKRVPVKTETPKQQDDDDSGDETAKEQLRDATTAMNASDWSRAEHLANMVDSAEHATARQRARAAMIIGIVACAAHNDEEKAHAQLRKVGRNPMFRAKLLAACHQHGYLQNER